VFCAKSSGFGVAVNNYSHRKELIFSSAGKLFTDYSQASQ
jgi:hypothetical protein